MSLAGQVNQLITRLTGLEVRRVEPPSRRVSSPNLCTKRPCDERSASTNYTKKIENLEGDVVECGIGTGRSFIILSTLVKQSDRRRTIFGFDTFTGFPDPKEVDQVSLRFIKKHRRKKCPPKEIVIQRMVNCGFDREWIDQNVTLLKGEFKDSLPNAPLKKLHFSTWTAISTKATWTVSISSTQK